MRLPEFFFDARRWMLRNFVPEWYWPINAICDGVSIPIRNTPYSFGTRRAICKGIYEWPERQLVNSHIQPGMQVLELGGSIGIVTATIARRVGVTGRIVSVEASPKISGYATSLLKNSGASIDFVCGYAFPVWHLPPDLHVKGFEGEKVTLGGRVFFEFSEPKSDPAKETKPSPVGEMSATAAGQPRNYDLETLCHEHHLQPDALVMDIESSEEIVLREVPNMPASLKIIIAELHPWLYPNGQSDVRRILDVFAREGFIERDQAGSNWCLKRD